VKIISHLQILHHQSISLLLKTGHLVTFVFTVTILLGVAAKARKEKRNEIYAKNQEKKCIMQGERILLACTI
jgi:hypothetical protein